MSDEELREKYKFALGELGRIFKGYLDYIQRDMRGSHEEVLESLDYEKKYRQQIVEKYLEAIDLAKNLQIPNFRNEIFNYFSDIPRHIDVKQGHTDRVKEQVSKIVHRIQTRLDFDSLDGETKQKGNVVMFDPERRKRR